MSPFPHAAWLALAGALLAAGLYLGGLRGDRVGSDGTAEPGSTTGVPDTPVRYVPLPPGSGVDKPTFCGEPPRRSVVEFNGTGVGVLDYDGDGWLDLYVVNGGRLAMEEGPSGSETDRRIAGWYGYANHLYRNLGDGRFAETAAAAGVDDQGWGQGVAVGDVNGDGLPDLYVTNLGPNRLFLNLGDGRFEDASQRLGLADPRWGASAAFFDLEGDGDLDLVVANYLVVDLALLDLTWHSLCDWKGIKIGCGPTGFVPEPCALYRNEGPAGFLDVGPIMGLERPQAAFPLGVLPLDADADGDVDIYVGCDAGANLLYLNEGGRLRESAAEFGLAVNARGEPEASMGLDAADLDGDGRPEIFLTHFSDQTNTLYSAAPFPYRDVTDAAGLAAGSTFMDMGWGTRFLDYDHDGRLDILVAQGQLYGNVHELADPRYTYAQHNLLYRGLPDGRFVETGQEVGLRALPAASSRGLAVADLDNDGDLDWVETVMDGPPRVWLNRGGNRRAWIGLHLEGRISNTEGVGARITLTTGAGTPQERTQVRWVTRAGSHQSSSDVRAHFGLDGAETADRVELRWPSGRIQVFRNLAARRYYRLVETEEFAHPQDPGPGF